MEIGEGRTREKKKGLLFYVYTIWVPKQKDCITFKIKKFLNQPSKFTDSKSKTSLRNTQPKILEKSPKLKKKKINDKYILIERIKFFCEGSIQGNSPFSWLPALPSGLMGQLETNQASWLLHWALTLAMKFLMKGHMLTDAAEETEVGGSLEMKLMLGSAQLLTGDLEK